MAFVLVLVLLLAGFSPVRTFPVASAESASPSADFPETVIEVRTVDEFLSAIGSDRVIRLMEGEYNLTQAVSYGQSATGEFWYWEDGYDGFQLRIFGVQNLSILGSNAEVCNIVTAPRYANVLSWSCRGCASGIHRKATAAAVYWISVVALTFRSVHVISTAAVPSGFPHPTAAASRSGIP